MRKIASVIYFMEDLEVGKSWFEKFLEVNPSYESENFILFTFEDFEIGLHLLDIKSKDFPGNQVCYFEVKNLEEEIERIRNLGGEIYRDTIISSDGTKVCQMKTPFNVILGLKESK